MNVIQLMTSSLKEHPQQRSFFSPIPATEWPEFVNGIDLNGIIVPLFVSARDGVTVLDGHQRVTAARELGLETVPVVLREFEEEADEVAFMVTVNDGRRHDSAETRATRADYFLRKYVGQNVSDYTVAAKAGVSQMTAQRRRKKLEAEGEIPERKHVVGRDGKKQAARKSGKTSVLPETTAVAPEQQDPLLELPQNPAPYRPPEPGPQRSEDYLKAVRAVSLLGQIGGVNLERALVEDEGESVTLRGKLLTLHEMLRLVLSGAMGSEGKPEVKLSN